MQERYYLEEQRAYVVTQHNDFIRKTHYNLTLVEQKVFLYLVSRIRPEDTEFDWYSFTIEELCKVFGYNNSGKNYNQLKKALKALRDKSLWLNVGEWEEAVGWLHRVRLSPRSGVVEIKFNDVLKPYLLGLRKNFTPFQLENILVMRSVHCILIYELLLSYSRPGEPRDFIISVDRLKGFLQVSENYEDYNNFKRRVLEPSLKQINGYTDLQVTMKPIRQGRFIRDLQFILVRDDDPARHWDRAKQREKALDGDKWEKQG